MWERFSYYGMRALLVFFLTERFLFSDRLSFALYGGYTALVYIVAIGNYFAALIAGFSAVDVPARLGAQDGEMLGHYQRFFGCVALGSLLGGLLALLATPMIRRWMGAVR